MPKYMKKKVPITKTTQNALKYKAKTLYYVMQSYPPRVLDRRLQKDWARAAKEGPRVLMNLRVDF